ncbi:hypothetical protein EV401DRAFT_1966261 [Pisolithus croceorrhizus]|nr:hypothetical protein EV401DRAFT_1966261 [Pisolithus croceorrhizus]
MPPSSMSHSFIGSSLAFLRSVIASISAHFLAIWSKREYNSHPAPLSQSSSCISTVSFCKRTWRRFPPVSCRSNSPDDSVCFQ